jgi:hypothetical protein
VTPYWRTLLFLMRRQRTVVSLAAGILGKIQAMGKFRGTIDPLIFPKARIFPIRCSANRTGERLMVRMWLTVLLGAYPGLSAWGLACGRLRKPGVRMEAAGSAGPGVTPETYYNAC